MLWLGYSVKILVLTNHDLRDSSHLLTYDRWQIVDLDDYRNVAGEHFTDLIPVENEPEEDLPELQVTEDEIADALSQLDDPTTLTSFDWIDKLINDNGIDMFQ